MGWEARHHLEQQVSNGCVAACVGMVKRRRDQTFDEAALMGRATEDGLSMSVAAGEVSGRYAVWSPSELKEHLDLLVEDETCVVVKVSGPAYMRRAAEVAGRSTSRHGDLAPPGDFGGPLHALLVVAVDNELVSYLDPWFPSDGQPFTMKLDDLLGIFVGAAVVVTI